MKVGEMCSRGVVSVFESASLRDVASLMKERHVGAVVVVAKLPPSPQLVGIITDRDFVWSLMQHVADLSRLRVADVMTKSPLTLRSDQELDEAINTHQTRKNRQTPNKNSRRKHERFLST